jgi:hypothetical protein
MKKEFKKPDVKAPRYRLCSMRLIDKDMLQRFKEKHPEFKDLTITEFRRIVEAFNGKLWDTAIDYRDGVELPEGLGFIFIGTCPSPKKTNTDYSKSLKLGTRVRHRNFESDNYLAKIFYTNYANKYKFKNREVWMFKGIRQFTREVSKVYPTKWNTFVKVDSYMHIRELYKKHGRREWARKEGNKLLENYNEFDLEE